MTRHEPGRPHAVRYGMCRRLLTLLLPVALIVAASGSAAAASAGVRLRTLDGTATSLADQVQGGRWTLLMMWTTYCSVCRGQYPIISAFHTRHRERDATVVGIALDGYDAMQDVRAYVAKKPFAFPTVVGEPDIVGGAYTAATGEAFTGTPSYLLFDPARRLVAARSGEVTLEALETYLAKERP